MNAPDLFALAGTDAELMEAYDRLNSVLPRWRRPGAAINDDEMGALTGELYADIEFINNTPPATLAGCAVKLQVLAAEGFGIEAGARDDDYISLRQVAEFIARESGLRGIPADDRSTP